MMGIKQPFISTHVKHTITLATPRETNINVLLPTSKPATPQVTYTVQESDLADISASVHDTKWLMHFYVTTYHNTGSGKTINVDVDINGSPWQSHSSTNNNDNHLTCAHRKTGIQVGDVIEAYVWESTGTVTLWYHGLSITPTQICPQKDKTMVNFVMNDTTSVPIFTASGNPSIIVNRYNLKHGNAETTGTTINVYEGSWESEDGDFIIRQQYGDEYGGDWYQATNSSYGSVPAMYGNRIPRNIEYDVLL